MGTLTAPRPLSEILDQSMDASASIEIESEGHDPEGLLVTREDPSPRRAGDINLYRIGTTIDGELIGGWVALDLTARTVRTVLDVPSPGDFLHNKIAGAFGIPANNSGSRTEVARRLGMTPPGYGMALGRELGSALTRALVAAGCTVSMSPTGVEITHAEHTTWRELEDLHHASWVPLDDPLPLDAMLRVVRGCPPDDSEAVEVGRYGWQEEDGGTSGGDILVDVVARVVYFRRDDERPADRRS